MRAFDVPTREQVAPAAQAVFDNLQKALGMVPNLYAFIGKSANALVSYVAFQQAQARGTFDAASGRRCSWPYPRSTAAATASRHTQ
jgi:hypothetical protein